MTVRESPCYMLNMPLQPKVVFANNDPMAKAHRALLEIPAFQTAALYTLAELARMNLSADEMRGANKFLNTFEQLAEKTVESEVELLTPKLVPWEKLTQPPKK